MPTFKFKVIILFLSFALLQALNITCINAQADQSQITNTLKRHSLPDYWIWAGYSAKDLSSESTLYLHQATVEVVPNKKIQEKTLNLAIRRQGLGATKLANPLILVYRLEALPDPNLVLNQFLNDQEMWRLKGNHVLGIQLDFDSPTNKLDLYINFLIRFKENLPKQFRFSVTGLADWASNSPPEVLNSIQKITDEIVFQVYTGKSPVPEIHSYYQSLATLSTNFKLGVLESYFRIFKLF